MPLSPEKGPFIVGFTQASLGFTLAALVPHYVRDRKIILIFLHLL